MGNPARDTAGLLSLTAVVGATEEGAEAPPALQRAVALRRMLDDDAYYDTTEQLLTALAERDRESEEAALTLVSAFPALEHDVLAYNRRNPKVRLAAIYPVDGTVEADYPYLTLAAEWVSDRKREIAEAFLAHVRSDGPQATLRNAGFRGADGEPGADLTAEYGLSPEIVALPHAQLAPEAVTLTIDRWTALTSRLNVLLLFDTAEPPDDAEPWLEEARTAAQRVVELLDGDDQFGLWQPPQAAGEGFRTVVPLGALADILDDGRSRRDHVQAALADLAPASDAGLYVAIQAAFDTVLASYQQGAANLVVVVTDGTGSPTTSPPATCWSTCGPLRPMANGYAWSRSGWAGGRCGGAGGDFQDHRWPVPPLGRRYGPGQPGPVRGVRQRLEPLSGFMPRRCRRRARPAAAPPWPPPRPPRRAGRSPGDAAAGPQVHPARVDRHGADGQPEVDPVRADPAQRAHAGAPPDRLHRGHPSSAASSAPVTEPPGQTARSRSASPTPSATAADTSDSARHRSHQRRSRTGGPPAPNGTREAALGRRARSTIITCRPAPSRGAEQLHPAAAGGGRVPLMGRVSIRRRLPRSASRGGARHRPAGAAHRPA